MLTSYLILGAEIVWQNRALIVGGFIVATAVEFLAESGFSLIDWEADWAESQPAIVAAFIASGVVALGIIYVLRKKAVNSKASSEELL